MSVPFPREEMFYLNSRHGTLHYCFYRSRLCSLYQTRMFESSFDLASRSHCLYVFCASLFVRVLVSSPLTKKSRSFDTSFLKLFSLESFDFVRSIPLTFWLFFAFSIYSSVFKMVVSSVKSVSLMFMYFAYAFLLSRLCRVEISGMYVIFSPLYFLQFCPPRILIC